ncbi:MAG: hypothetical protein NTW28_09330 [Candidatus Solibacter sp.]|nr:hypothetical protein [Candidatus Solibacter sp.]
MPPPAAPSAPAAPAWLRPLLLGLTAMMFLTWFTGEVADTDIWLHLMTGRHTLEARALTVPDPFCYTSNLTSTAYPGEAKTRYFNLTHEWLAQILMYVIHGASGFPGLVLLRALLLIAFCWLVGLIVWWRTGGYYRSLAAAIAAGAVAINFQQSRPFLVTFVLLAVTMAILERRRWMWALVPVFVFWANCHGGYFMGWVMLGAYCGEALIRRLRRQPVVGERQLWLVTIASFLASAINPNGFRVIEIMMYYRGSSIQSSNLEWQYPAFWLPPYGYGVVLLGSLAAMLISRRKTRPVDWILYFVFAAASLMAVRNTILMGLVGAVLLGAYLPAWKRAIPAAAEFAAAGLVLLTIGLAVSGGGAFQWRAAEWMLPVQAADFLKAHNVSGRMFNTYENGGYLVWRLWPAQRDFIDPRGLSEEAYADYSRILSYADSKGGKSVDELLAKYGIEVLVLNGFDRFSGHVHTLAAALSDPSQKEWKLVQADNRSVVFMRHPPAGLQPLNNLHALQSIETQCQQQIEHDPKQPACARGIADFYTRIGQTVRAAQWMSYYDSRSH